MRFSHKIVFAHCNLFHCVLYSAFSPVNVEFFVFVYERYELKMNNLLVDVEIFSFVIKKLYFKQSFNNISRIRGHLFSQINFDQIFFFFFEEGGFVLGVFGMEEFCPGGFVWGFISEGDFVWRIYVLEPTELHHIHPKKRRHILTHYEYSLCAKRFSHHCLLSSNRRVSKCRSRL